MKNNFTSFFKLVWFEFLKLLRSPVVLLFLLLGPLLMEITLGSIMQNTLSKAKTTQQQQTQQEQPTTTINENIVFVKNGELNQDVSQTLNSFFKDAEISWNDNLKNSLSQLYLQNCLMVFFVDTEKDPQEIQIYYDEANFLSQTLAIRIRMIQQQYVYVAVLDYLKTEWGITIQQEYFNVANFNNTASMNFFSRYFSMFLSVFIAFVLTIGLSFSIARDNETNVFKQLCYTPISTNRYLLIKGFLYILFAMLNAGLMLLGGLLFGLEIAGNVGILLLFTLLFSMSFGAMNMLFSTTKNQIGAVSLALLFILVPALVEMILTLNILPTFFRIITLISPLMSFLELSQSYILYGVFDVTYLIIMAVEMVVYYVLAVIIIKHKTGTSKTKLKLKHAN